MSGLPSYYDEWRTASEDRPAHMRPYLAKCEDCDEKIYGGDAYYPIDGLYYCENCMDTNYRTSSDENVLCDDCGEEVEFDDSAYFIHGKWYCERCMEFMKSMA